MTEIITEVILNPLVLMFLGLLGNFFKNLLALKDRGINHTPLSYIKENPYRVIVSIIGILIGYSLLVEFDQLTTLNALSIGYMSHSVLDFLTAKAETSIKSMGAKK